MALQYRASTAHSHYGGGVGMQGQPGSAAAEPVTKMRLTISLRDVVKLDVLSHSDPMVVLFLQSIRTQNQHLEIGRTEVVKNKKDVDFATTLTVDYFFEELQTLRFAVYDEDRRDAPLRDQDFVGEVEVTLADIVGVHRGYLSAPLKHPQSKKFRGTLIVQAEEIKSGDNALVHMNLRGAGLDKKDLFGKSDPFLKIMKSTSTGWVMVHQTEVVKKTLDPVWKQFTVNLGHLCDGDPERPLRVECFDWDANGSNDYIGGCETTLAQLQSEGGLSLNLINEKKAERKKHYQNSGFLQVVSCEVEQRHTFLDYIHAGFELNFVVAVDFTASNGDPRKPGTLHFYNPPQPNAYVEAIDSVGLIIQDYDKDKLFPAFGFGARMPDGKVLFDFPLNNNPAYPACHGIQGVLDAYLRTLQSVQLYGPTNFAPVIHKAMQLAQQSPNTYTVLLIITDGVITDIADTIEAVVQASSMPLSIIIIGVGDADFSAMNRLDADEHALSSRGRTASRDIVQFVPMNKFSGPFARQQLAKEVLAELPDQFLQYVHAMKIPLPQAPPPAQYQPPSGGVMPQDGTAFGSSASAPSAPSAPPPPYGQY